MTAPAAPSYLRMLWLPVLITTGVSAARLYTQVEGDMTTKSGGGGSWLGIAWLMFVFGGWFALRLNRAGDQPRMKRAVVWFLLANVAVMVGMGIGFSGVDPEDRSDAARASLESGVFLLGAVASLSMLFTVFVWPRLAKTLLLYGLCARIGVLVCTYIAKSEGWETHYTKFGPQGFEYEMGGTMWRASVAQLTFWTPLTVVMGGLFGTVLVALASRRKAA